MRSIPAQLDRIRNPNCTLCPLHKSSVNVCVMGKGNYKPDIILVGEAPGEMEAKTDKPFMGRAGKFLDEVLDELQMKEFCYITNIVRCRPPNNRKPEPEEVKTCAETYFWDELKVVECTVIVTMGRTASDYILGEYIKPTTPKRGQLYTIIKGVLYVVATWHPSYVLRTQSRQWNSRKEFKDHLSLAMGQFIPF